MPLEWGSQAGSVAGRVEWGTQTNEAAAPTIVGFSGTLAPGEVVTFTTVLLGTVMSFTYGGISIPIDSTAANQFTVTMPAALELDLDWGEEHEAVAGDGTDTAARDFALEAEDGWAFFALESVPDFVDTDSLAENAENAAVFIGYTAAAGQQIQYTTHADLTVDAQSIVYVNPEQTLEGFFRVRYTDDDGITERYIESLLHIGEPDLTPNDIVFTDVSNAIASTPTESETITPDGFNQPLPIEIDGGQYSINGGAPTSAPGTINPGETLQLFTTSAASYPGTQVATVTIGSVDGVWNVVNLSSAPDNTPDVLDFPPVIGATVSTEYISESLTPVGYNIPATIAVDNCEYSIDENDFTADPGTLNPGEALRLRVTSSDQEDTPEIGTVTLSGVDSFFRVTTVGEFESITANISIAPIGGAAGSDLPDVYEDNVTTINVTDTTTESGEVLSALEVTAQIRNLSGTAIGDLMTLDAVDGTDGAYSVKFLPPASLRPNNEYYIELGFQSGGSRIAEFNQRFAFKRRGIL